MHRIYRDAMGFMRASFPLLVVLAVLFALAPRFAGATGSFGVWGGNLAFFYFIHRYFLFGENLLSAPDAQTPLRKGFWLFMALVSIPAAALLFVVFVIPDPAETEANARARYPYLFAGLLVFELFLGVFGTLLPWAIDRARSYRFSRGLRTAPATVLCLMLSSFPLKLVVNGGFLYALPYTQQAPAIFGFVADILFQMGDFLAAALAAAVLCTSYREALAGPDGR